MDTQKAIDVIREYLTTLHNNPNIYEDGTCNIIHALEYYAIPLMERDIDKKPEVYPCNNMADFGKAYIGCPNCQEFIKYKYDIYREEYYPYRCPECGQALKWE